MGPPRQAPPDKQTKLVSELLQTGVDIGICRLDDVFTEEDMDHKWTTLSVFIQLAHQESKQKSRRASLTRGRNPPASRENGKIMSAKLPAWLQVRNGEPIPIPERVAVVQRIFRLSAEGYGLARIIKTLIKEGTQPFGRSGKWAWSYVEKILNDKRVLGQMQPRKGKAPDGEVIEKYYPRIIDDELYHLARAGQDDRRGRGGKRDRRYVNTFQSLLTSRSGRRRVRIAQPWKHGTSSVVACYAAGTSGERQTRPSPT